MLAEAAGFQEAPFKVLCGHKTKRSQAGWEAAQRRHGLLSAHFWSFQVAFGIYSQPRIPTAYAEDYEDTM